MKNIVKNHIIGINSYLLLIKMKEEIIIFECFLCFKFMIEL